MQAGGKIEGEEDVRSALLRELSEEIGLELEAGAGHYLGCFTAPAANEADCTVEAELFHIRSLHRPLLGAEIEEAIWVLPAEAELLSLAPLTRECVMPLARML
jgi:8-oxo-dGTP pyrophosphatase MutT (NUDIX family)